MVELVQEVLGRAITRRASDVHFEPQEGGLLVRYRLDGVLQDTDLLPGRLAENVVARLKVLAGLLTYRPDVPQEGAFTAPGDWAGGEPLDLRVATFPTVRGERAVVRLLYSTGLVAGLDALGLRPDTVSRLRQVAERPAGLILVTGPAGSGKTTTLYGLARHILTVSPGRSVVSLEDPVEQRVAGMAQIQVTPYGELDYPRAMRSLLRQDVQVLLVGEIRDAETAHIVIEASLTGHLIMSTLHSGDPAEAMVRLLEMGIAPYQLVGALSAVCSQRLVRTLCTACGGEGVDDGPAEQAIRRDPRCPACGDSGYRGRTACGHVAVMDERIRGLLLARSPAGALREAIARQGPDLVADARRLEAEGVTRRDELLRVLGTLD